MRSAPAPLLYTYRRCPYAMRAFEALPLPALKGWLHGWLSTTLFNTAMTKLPANQTTAFPTA